ncbi:MAG TPA: sigma factor [Gaiellaceae bacterium]|nr:sigma factor [Gaiellaceae bacterium]HET8652948.1 sigma factor [Gaiellaceae bacterium]
MIRSAGGSAIPEDEAERRRRFDALFASYSPDILAYCGWRSGSASDAQDAAAEVFLTAWRRLDEVPEGDAARIWLYATARRMLANQRRSKRRRAALRERLVLDAATRPPEAAPPESDGSLVGDALRRLPPGIGRCSCSPNGRASPPRRSRPCSGA